MLALPARALAPSRFFHPRTPTSHLVKFSLPNITFLGGDRQSLRRKLQTKTSQAGRPLLFEKILDPLLVVGAVPSVPEGIPTAGGRTYLCVWLSLLHHSGGASEIQAEVAIFPCGFWVILKQVNVA